MGRGVNFPWTLRTGFATFAAWPINIGFLAGGSSHARCHSSKRSSRTETAASGRMTRGRAPEVSGDAA